MNPLQNLLDPAILFFVFGVIAGLLRSNLEVPPQIARFLSLYLLMSVGLKGGFSLAHTGSVTGAAEAEHVTQPTVSMQLRQLSEAAGVPLYEALPRGVRLTDAGQHLAQACEDILHRSLDNATCRFIAAAHSN